MMVPRGRNDNLFFEERISRPKLKALRPEQIAFQHRTSPPRA